MKIKSKEKELYIGENTLIMGIINFTPDSFSDGGLYDSVDEVVKTAVYMLENGADIIDVGGESTRPFSDRVDENEELRRVIPIIEELRNRTDAWISIDTYKSKVAECAVQAGADIINDVSGLRFDSKMTDVVRDHDVPVVVMHMLGEPKNMQDNPVYGDVVKEIHEYFEERIEYLVSNGISSEKIIIDPGIGFGKTIEHNLKIINNLDYFKSLGKPILAGPSRKAFIGKILDTDVNDRLEGTAAAVSLLIARGADIVRVHDVKEMRRVSVISDAITNS
ncbi:dihydropteroate synthase [candidate division KSB1 bacterium]